MPEHPGGPERDSIWQRMAGPRPAPKVQLTHEQIAAAAVEIADAEGLQGVSMRRLADRLGIATMGLYRYVRGRDDIVELMADRVYGEDEPAGPPEPEADWQATLRAEAWRLRALLLRHPWLVQTVTSLGSQLTPAYLARVDRLLAALDGLGLDEDTKMALIGTVTSFVTGTVAAHFRLARLLEREGAGTMNDLRVAYASRMRWFLGTGRYPAYERYIKGGVRKDDADWQFDLGLESVLAGIASRLGR